MRRLWLHQANANMNRLIAQRVLGHEASDDESPTVLDTYGNTSSAGSIIAFHLNHEDMVAGDTGLICSFGAGYSAGRCSSGRPEFSGAAARRQPSRAILFHAKARRREEKEQGICCAFGARILSSSLRLCALREILFGTAPAAPADGYGTKVVNR